MKDKPNYYGILPASVRYDKKVPASAGYLFTEITALSGKEGYCYANNRYFADLYEVEPNTISRWISVLRKRGHIKVVYDNGVSRKMYAIMGNAPLHKNVEGGTQKCRGGVHKNVEHINTSINTNTNNTISKEKKTSSKEELVDESETVYNSNLGPFGGFYGNMPVKAQQDMNLFYGWDGKIEECIKKTGYSISLELFEECKKTFIQKLKNYGQKRASTFLELEGYFITWLSNGYERSKRNEKHKVYQNKPIVQKSLHSTTLEQEKVVFLNSQEKSPEMAQKLRIPISKLRSKSGDQILENMNQFLKVIESHKEALSRYTPITEMELVALEWSFPTKKSKEDLMKALYSIMKYRPSAKSIYQALKIQIKA